MKNKYLSKILFVLVVLFLAKPVLAENNSSDSKNLLGESKEIDLLEGATDYTGPYPEPADVTYKERNGEEKTVTAYPGQIIIYFNDSVDQKDAKALIEANGGTILAQTPRIRFYFVGVTVGSEGKFITSIYKDNRVDEISPNVAGSLSLSK